MNWPDNCEDHFILRVQKVKRLSPYDYQVCGKRFAIKQPPILSINNKTLLQYILVKSGVSTLTLKDFLL